MPESYEIVAVRRGGDGSGARTSLACRLRRPAEPFWDNDGWRLKFAMAGRHRRHARARALPGSRHSQERELRRVGLGPGRETHAEAHQAHAFAGAGEGFLEKRAIVA